MLKWFRLWLLRGVSNCPELQLVFQLSKFSGLSTWQALHSFAIFLQIYGLQVSEKALFSYSFLLRPYWHCLMMIIWLQNNYYQRWKNSHALCSQIQQSIAEKKQNCNLCCFIPTISHELTSNSIWLTMDNFNSLLCSYEISCSLYFMMIN